MTSQPIITAAAVGKRYVLGREASATRYRTLREEVTTALTAPFRRKGPQEAATKEGSEEFWALRDVSFEIGRGEVVGIIGRNGAGKSTLLKVLSRITEPSAGRISLRGRVASLLEVGTGFHPELTGRENIFLNGAILGMHRAEIKAKFDEIVAFAEVAKFLDTPVKRYSSGMYVRLAFAVAAHLEPEILVVDEVLAVGDAEFQKKCLGKMRDVARGEGRTVLFVSHQMNAVEQLCNRAILLAGGRVREDRHDVHAVIQRYLAGSGEENGDSACWENRPDQHVNPWFRPLRLCVVDAEGQPALMPAANDTELWLQIDAHIDEVDPSLTIGYAIYTDENALLYWSYQTDDAPDRWPRLRTGRVTLRSRLPGRFFNEGTYRIELIGGLHHRQWLFQPNVNAPTITLRLQGRLSDSPLWLEKRPGLLAPVFPWTLLP